MKKRLLSALLTLCMVLTLLPVSALAAESGNGGESAAQQLSAGDLYAYLEQLALPQDDGAFDATLGDAETMLETYGTVQSFYLQTGDQQVTDETAPIRVSQDTIWYVTTQETQGPTEGEEPLTGTLAEATVWYVLTEDETQEDPTTLYKWPGPGGSSSQVGNDDSVYLFIALPSNTSYGDSGSDYRFLTYGGKVSDQASKSMDAVIDTSNEANITQYISTWPTELKTDVKNTSSDPVGSGSAWTINSNTGEVTAFDLNIAGNRYSNDASKSYDGNSYSIRWVKFSYASTGNHGEHYHADAALFKNVTVNNALENAKKVVNQSVTLENSQTFTFTLANVDENGDPIANSDFVPVDLIATVNNTGTQGAADITVETANDGNKVLNPGRYRIVETSEDWKSDPIYFTVTTDGTVTWENGISTITNRRDGTDITIKVWVDGKEVLNDSEYASANGGETAHFSTSTASNGDIIVDYAYEQYNCADFSIAVIPHDYVLQGVSADVIYTSDVDQIAVENNTITLDNVSGGSTVNVYLRTPYTVLYHDGDGKTVQDTNTYIVNEDVNVTTDISGYPSTNSQDGTPVSWKAPSLLTEIDLRDLPAATSGGQIVSGWYTNEDATDTEYVPNGENDPLAVSKVYNTADEKNVINFYAKETEQTVTINYVAQTGGSVSRSSETVGVETGTIQGSTASVTNDSYYFVGWYDENGNLVSTDLTFTPTKKVSATYTARFAQKQEVTITANSESKEYNGAVQTVTGYEVSGLPESYIVEGLTASGSGKDVNTEGYAVTFTGTPVIKDANGTDVTAQFTVTTVNGKLTITPKEVTVKADNQTKTYGEEDPDLTATVSGLIESDTVNYTLSRVDGEDAGNYTITPTGAADQGNYKVKYETGTLTINKKNAGTSEAQLSCNNGEWTYDGNAHSKTAKVTGTEADQFTVYYKVGNDDWTTEEPSVTNVSDGVVTVQVKATSDNYNDLTGSFTIQINSSPVTITVNNAEKFYGETDPPFTGSITSGSLVSENDLGQITYTRENTGEEHVGTYEDVLDADFTENSNYAVTVVKGDFTIKTAVVSGAVVTASGGSKTYDGTPLQVTAQLTADAAGYTIQYKVGEGEWTTQVPSVTHVNEGTKTVSVQAVKDGYETLTCDPVTIRITPATLTIVTDSASKVYDGTPLTAGGTITGLQNEETVTFKVMGTQTDIGSSNNGYTLSWNGSAKSYDYKESFTLGTLTVNPVGSGSVTVTKTVVEKQDGYVAGDDVQWTITVTNNTEYKVFGLKLSDVIGSTTLTLTANDPATNDPNNFDLDAGASATFTATLSNAAAGTYTNHVDVKQDGSNDPITGDDADPVTVEEQKPALSVTKTADKSTAGVNETVTYQIKVSNTGNTALSNVTVTDTFTGAGKLTFGTGSGYNVTDNNNGTYTITIDGVLGKGQDVTISATYTILPADAEKGAVKNTAVASSGDTESDPADITVPVKSGVKISKKADSDSIRIGSSIKYTVTVENTGDVPLKNVVVTDSKWTSGTKIQVTVGTTTKIETLTGDTYTYDGPLAAGASIKITYTLTPTEVGSYSNKVEVTAELPTTVTGEDGDETPEKVTGTATETVTVNRRPSNGSSSSSTSKPQLNKEDHFAYVSGYPDGTVQPNDYITREEVATIFFRLLTDKSRADYITEWNPFPDITSSRWSFYSITTMNNGELMVGRNNGLFDPSANITRAEFAVVAAQFSDAKDPNRDYFTDVSGHWAESYINRAASVGWIAGYPDGTFRPDQPITRAEVMALVNEVLERAPHEDHMLRDMIHWPDNRNEDIWYYEDVQEATNAHTYVWTSVTEDGKKRQVEDWQEIVDMPTYDELVRAAFLGKD